MIVYPIWNTTPSPEKKLKVADRRDKQRVFHNQEKGEQLPLFIDDYAISKNSVNTSKSISQFLQEAVAKISLEEIINSINYKEKISKKITNLDFLPNFDLESTSIKYKVLETFDNSIYLQAYKAADAIDDPSGTVSLTVEVTRDQLPPALLELPNGISLSKEELANMFGLPASTLISVTLEVITDKDDPFSGLDPVYRVTFERVVAMQGDIF